MWLTEGGLRLILRETHLEEGNPCWSWWALVNLQGVPKTGAQTKDENNWHGGGLKAPIHPDEDGAP